MPVTVDGVGRVTYKLFTDRDGRVVRAQDTYAQRFVVTNTLTGATYTIRDVGPDRVLFEDGAPVVLQQIGRSTTGSGTIGRTVFTLTPDGDLVEQSRSGREFGDFVERTCSAIT